MANRIKEDKRNNNMIDLPTEIFKRVSNRQEKAIELYRKLSETKRITIATRIINYCKRNQIRIDENIIFNLIMEVLLNGNHNIC